MLPTNIWSCGESSELGFNDNSPSTDISINKSNEWSNIGNYSAKCDISDTGAYVGYKITDIQELAGKTIQFSAYINTPVKLKISIYQLVNGSYSETAVTVPALTNSENSVSVTLNENAERILLRICHNEQTLTEQISYYSDNWCLEEVTQ